MGTRQTDLTKYYSKGFFTAGQEQFLPGSPAHSCEPQPPQSTDAQHMAVPGALHCFHKLQTRAVPHTANLCSP